VNDVGEKVRATERKPVQKLKRTVLIFSRGNIVDMTPSYHTHFKILANRNKLDGLYKRWAALIA